VSILEYNEGKDKFFHNGRAKAGSIKKVRSELYVGSDGSVYEIDRFGLFQKYKQIVPADNEPEYETCKECGQVHNGLANRTYSDIKTSIDVVLELFRKAKVMEPI
jgi:hypothetical protein